MMGPFRTPRLVPTLIVLAISLGSCPAAWGEDPKPAEVDPVRDTIVPQPLTPIPDDPPPHEGAMITLPYIIEPADLIIVEVLEALPGRPISGERLVRPDGTINLSFYGDVQVRGLTVAQAKEKIIRHLRTHLPDEVLGLLEYNSGPLAPFPPGDLQNLKKHVSEKPKAPQSRTEPKGASDFFQRPSGKRQSALASRVRRASQQTPEERAPSPLKAPPSEVAQTPVPPAAASPGSLVPLPPGSQVRITIDITPGPAPAPAPPVAEATVPEGPSDAELTPVRPVDSTRVFVDVTAYNSKIYFVQGDVAAPGKLPYTGNETVLDAMNYAGGIIPSADRKNIRLIRPARGGKPAKVYMVDLEAITERGEKEKNYQLFPGDRLVVGRNPVVTATLEIDRLASPLQSVISSMSQSMSMARSLAQSAAPAGSSRPAILPPDQRDALIKEWTSFWLQVVARPGESTLDEQTLREALTRALNPPGADRK